VLVALPRLREAPDRLVAVSQVVAQGRIVAVPLQSVLEGDNRFLVASLGVVEGSEIVVGDGQIRRGCGRPLVGGDRLIKVAEVLVNVAEVVQDLRVSRLPGDGALDQLQCLRGVSGLPVEDRQVVEGFRILRLQRQGLVELRNSRSVPLLPPRMCPEARSGNELRSCAVSRSATS